MNNETETGTEKGQDAEKGSQKGDTPAYPCKAR
jgi:hypothetical protein